MFNLKETAIQSLRANIVSIDGKKYLTAGRHQFKTLWTRDFAYSVAGLLTIEQIKVVQDHLDLLLQFKNQNNLIPRVVDSLPVPLRVALSCLIPSASLPIWNSLKPQYHDEHGSKAIDSNLLFMLAAKSFQKFNPAWFSENSQSIKTLLQYYEPLLDMDGLIVQPAFSDWQDSAKRLGKTSYTNFLYCWVLHRYQDKRFEKTFTEFKKTFYDSEVGLFKSIDGKNYFSLDVQLMILLSGLLPQFCEPRDSEKLYMALRSSKLWKGIATIPNYPTDDLSLAVRIAGNKNYHGDMIWTWLVALQALAAHKFGSENDRDERLEFLKKSSLKSNAITEILDSETLLPFRSLLYRSEQPFSWGAAMTVWVLGAIENKNIDFL
jgi:glycogen debranching enzyme